MLSKKEIESIFFENCMNCSNGELELMYREGYLYEDAIGWNNDTIYGERISKCVEMILKAERKKYISPNEEIEYKDMFLTQIGEVIALRKSGSLVLHYSDYPLIKRQVNIDLNKDLLCSQCRSLFTKDDIISDNEKHFVFAIKMEYALLGNYNLDLCYKCKCVYDDSKKMKKEKEEYRSLVIAINEMTSPDIDNDNKIGQQ